MPDLARPRRFLDLPRHANARRGRTTVPRRVTLVVVALLAFGGSATAVAVSRLRGNVATVGSLDGLIAAPTDSPTEQAAADRSAGRAVTFVMLGSDTRAGENAAIAAVLRKALSADVLTSPVSLARFLDAGTRSLTMSDGLKAELPGLAWRLRDVEPSAVTFVTVPWGPGTKGRIVWTGDATTLWGRIAADEPIATPAPGAAGAAEPTAGPAPAPAPASSADSGVATARRGSRLVRSVSMTAGCCSSGGAAPAVRREVLARTSLVVEVRDVLGVDSWRASLVPSNRRSASTDTHAIRIVYAGRVVGGMLDGDDFPGAAERFGWVAVEALPHQARAELVDTALAWAEVATLT